MATRFVSEAGNSSIWQATNGKLFGTEAEAIAEENSKQYESKVSAFIASKIWNRGQDTRAKAMIIEFLAWSDTEAGAAAIEAAANATEAEKATEEASDVPPAPPAPAA